MADLPLCELLHYAVYTYYIETYNSIMHWLLILSTPFYKKKEEEEEEVAS